MSLVILAVNRSSRANDAIVTAELIARQLKPETVFVVELPSILRHEMSAAHILLDIHAYARDQTAWMMREIVVSDHGNQPSPAEDLVAHLQRAGVSVLAARRLPTDIQQTALESSVACCGMHVNDRIPLSRRRAIADVVADWLDSWVRRQTLET